jgi:lipooligosaccharide transport system permease protein
MNQHRTSLMRWPGRRGVRLLERNAMVYRRLWPVLIAGLLEPGLYLLGIGYGVGSLVGTLDVDGHGMSYAAFIAPALIATAAMNGAVYDTTFSMLHKLHYERVYDIMLATPLRAIDLAVGEVGWALLRGVIYTTSIVALAGVLGLVSSGWALVAVPAAMVITFCFAAVGCAVTTFLTSWQDTENVNLGQMLLFLASGTFFPVDRYPSAVRWLVELSPLTRGVHLLRGLAAGGAPAEPIVLDIVFLVLVGAAGMAVAARRLHRIVLV